MVTFETEKDFMDAVMAVLAERLRMQVYVSMTQSYDYYSNGPVPKVEVVLMDSDFQCIVSGEGKA